MFNGTDSRSETHTQTHALAHSVSVGDNSITKHVQNKFQLKCVNIVIAECEVVENRENLKYVHTLHTIDKPPPTANMKNN